MSVTSENYVFVHEEGRSDDVRLSGVYHPEDRTLTYRLGNSSRRYRRDITCLVDDFERLSTGSNSLLAPPTVPILRNGEPSISERAAMYSDTLYNQMKLKRGLAELGVDGNQAVLQTFDTYTTSFDYIRIQFPGDVSTDWVIPGGYSTAAYYQSSSGTFND